MKARYTHTRLVNRCNSRFQSNHHRGYVWRNTIMGKGPKNNRPPEPAAAVDPASFDHCQISPDTAASTMRMGMAAIVNGAAVSTLSPR